jgi:hypothetical protein
LAQAQQPLNNSVSLRRQLRGHTLGFADDILAQRRPRSEERQRQKQDNCDREARFRR